MFFSVLSTTLMNLPTWDTAVYYAGTFTLITWAIYLFKVIARIIYPPNSNLKSITHTDGTCRFQTVDNTNKYFYNLIKEFYKLSGCPLLLNTSFNINGKPILGSTEDAINFYNKSEIDCLVVGDKIYNKKGR